MLKVSPWKGVIHFGKRGKLNPRYIEPFKIIAKVGTVAYHLELPDKLSRVHSMFHVSKLKKFMADEPLAIPLDAIQVDDKLNFIEEPIEIMDREVKRLKQSRIPIVKVRWNSKRGPEFTWEREDQMQKKYLHLFTNSAPTAEVMAILVISISLDSSEDSVGTPAGRVILFGTIPTTIPDTTPVITPPAAQTDTPELYIASPDYHLASDSESDPFEDTIIRPLPTITAYLHFLSSDDDTTDSDTPDTPPSPTHGTPFTKITASTQRSPIIPRRRVIDSSPWNNLIPHGSTVRLYPPPNRMGGTHDDCERKRVGPLTHSSSCSLRDILSHLSSLYHSSPDILSTSTRPSRKRRRSPTTSVHALPLLSGALSPIRADLIPSPKRFKDSGYLTNVEVDPREISLRDDAIVRVSDKPHLEQDIDPEIQVEIDECIAYADALRDREIDARVVVEVVDRDETETGVRGPVEVRVERVTHPAMPEDIPEPAQEGAVEVTYETLGDLVQRFHDHLKAYPSQSKMPNTRSGASMTHEEVKELVTRRVVKEMEAREAARTLEPLNENGGELEGENRGNGNRGNGGNENGGNRGNRNRNRNHGINYGGFMPVARECTFQDFLKCKPHNFSGTEGVVGLTRWFKKMETVFNISNYPPKYQVKYATCTLQDSALTWWNSPKRTIGVEAAYAMNWVELIRLMRKVYCPRNEI
ncbi:hypothetical protein Tco_1168692 [Tanacetum coccineum]